MAPLNRSPLVYLFTVAFGLATLTGCALETRPTLDEVRTGRVRGQVTEDTALQPGEIRAEVIEVDPAKQEIRVQTDNGGRRVLLYDRTGTRVVYHGWSYAPEQLESGDLGPAEWLRCRSLTMPGRPMSTTSGVSVEAIT